LTENELSTLVQMTQLTDATLLYRASRDGFTSSSFHSKCDGINKTVTLIQNNYGYVFGGYTTAAWMSYQNSVYINDTEAFVFSLRRNDYNPKTFRYNVTRPDFAICANLNYGPTFGEGPDIGIIDRSDINFGSSTNICNSYQCPYTLQGNEANQELSKKFFSGYTNKWYAIEIEVYQIDQYEPYLLQ
jgi:hypothetical protein